MKDLSIIWEKGDASQGRVTTLNLKKFERVDAGNKLVPLRLDLLVFTPCPMPRRYRFE